MRKLEGREIVVATHNEGKVRELNELISPFGLTARSARELGLPEPEENGETFEENAYTKAYSAASATGLPALSDDSGFASMHSAAIPASAQPTGRKCREAVAIS